MSVTKGIHGPGAREGGSGILLAAGLGSTLPAALTFSRVGGAGSYQTAEAINGTTFISYFTSGQVDVPRFHYLAAAGRRMLLVEPARTNRIPDANFVDSGADNVPDGWSAVGSAGTDFATVVTGAPHGGVYLRLLDTAGRGCFHSDASLLATTQYAASGWYRRVTASGPASVYTIGLNPGFPTLSLGAATHDWLRYVTVETTVNAGGNEYLLDPADGAAVGEIWATLPQVEAGAYGSTWIPTSGGSATRPAERCRIAASSLSADKGSVAFLWCPLWSNTDVTGTSTLFAWGANDRIDFDGATDTIRVINNSVVRAMSAALTFARESLHRIRVDYGSFGAKLAVDGIETTDATAWVSVVTLDAHLGSNSSGGNVESAGYGDLLLAG